MPTRRTTRPRAAVAPTPTPPALRTPTYRDLLRAEHDALVAHYAATLDPAQPPDGTPYRRLSETVALVAALLDGIHRGDDPTRSAYRSCLGAVGGRLRYEAARLDGAVPL